MRTKLVCALLLVTLALSSMSLASSATQVSAAPNGEPFDMTGFTATAPGIWVHAVMTTPDVQRWSDNATNRIWSNVFAPQFFVFGLNAYRVITATNDTYTDNGNIYTYWVRLISDPDGSLNATPARLSGDEISVWTWFVFQNGTYTYTLNHRMCYWSVWNYGSGNWQSMTSSDVQTLRTNANNTRYLPNIDPSVKAYCTNLLQFTTNQTTPAATKVSKYAYFAYWIDQAYRPKISRDSTGYDFARFVAKDRFVAFVAYNSGAPNPAYLDFIVKRRGATAAPTITSSNAVYVFRPMNATGVQCTFPTLAVSGTNQRVDWGFKITGLYGVMTSTDPSSSAQPVATVISSVEFDFHFTRNSTTAQVKVDEKIGQFNTPGGTTPPTQFQGLGLAILYYSFFEGLDIDKYQTTPTSASEAPLDNTGNVTATSWLNFMNGADKLAAIKFGGDTYLWNGTQTENALSNTAPWFCYATYFTELGNQSAVSVAYDRSKSVYASCFPEWSGYSITHDPYFAVFTASAPSGGTSPIMLIVAGAGIGVLAAAAILFVRRRKAAGA